MNETTTTNEEMLEFFKALSNVDRLKIAGLLASEPLNPVQIAERLHMQPQDVLRHLGYLEHLGIIQAEAGERIFTPAPGQTRAPAMGREAPPTYRFDTDALQKMSKRVLSGSRPQTKIEDFDGEAFDRKVLKDFMTPDGRLKAIPTQEKKVMVVVRHLAKAFEPGTRYTEKQVNEILRKYNEDTASLRRYLVDYKFLARENAVYWKIGE